MRGLRFLALERLDADALEVPGVRVTKKGNCTLVPWTAYDFVKMGQFKTLGPKPIASPLDGAVVMGHDAVEGHPLASARAKAAAHKAQREDLARAVRLRGGIVDWPCGGGKTLLGLLFATAFEPGARALIVSPSTTVAQWHREATKWLDTTNLRVGLITRGQPRVMSKREVTWTIDERALVSLRRRKAPEWLRIRSEWPEHLLQPEDLAMLRAAKCAKQIETSWCVVADDDTVMGRYSTEEEARENRGSWSVPDDWDVAVVGWAFLSKPEVVEVLTAWGPSVIVFDEIHRAKNPKRWTAWTGKAEADGTQEVEFRRNSSASASAQALAQEARAVLGLTATPQSDLPKDWWGVLDLIDPFGWGSFKEFSNRYCAAYQGPYGWVADGVSNVDELKRRINMTRFYRTKADTHGHLPPLMREFVDVEIRDAGPVDYEALKNELQAGELGGSPTALSIAVAAEQKTAWAVDRIVEYLREGLRCVVFVLLRSSAHRLTSELERVLPPGAVLRAADGLTAVEDRARAVQDVTSATAGGVLVATIGAMGESVDGMQHMNEALVLTVPWTPRMLRQVEGRLDRIGAQHRKRITYVRLVGSVDDVVWARVSGKLSMDASIRDDEAAKILSDELRGDFPEAEAKALDSMIARLEAYGKEMADHGIELGEAPDRSGAAGWGSDEDDLPF